MKAITSRMLRLTSNPNKWFGQLADIQITVAYVYVPLTLTWTHIHTPHIVYLKVLGPTIGTCAPHHWPNATRFYYCLVCFFVSLFLVSSCHAYAWLELLFCSTRWELLRKQTFFWPDIYVRMFVALFAIMIAVNNTWLTRKLEKMVDKWNRRLIRRTIEYETTVMQLLNT